MNAEGLRRRRAYGSASEAVDAARRADEAHFAAAPVAKRSAQTKPKPAAAPVFPKPTSPYISRREMNDYLFVRKLTQISISKDELQRLNLEQYSSRSIIHSVSKMAFDVTFASLFLSYTMKFARAEFPLAQYLRWSSATAAASYMAMIVHDLPKFRPVKQKISAPMRAAFSQLDLAHEILTARKKDQKKSLEEFQKYLNSPKTAVREWAKRVDALGTVGVQAVSPRDEEMLGLVAEAAQRSVIALSELYKGEQIGFEQYQVLANELKFISDEIARPDNLIPAPPPPGIQEPV